MSKLTPPLIASVSIDDIQSFLTVAATGSFRKAASTAGLGQSSLSRRVRRLEDELGVSLFERRSTGARLTNAGRCFSARIRVVVDDLNGAIEAARSSGSAENGYLRVGIIVSLSYGVARKIVQRFRSQHPLVHVCFFEANRGDLYTKLNHRRLDLVIAAGEPVNDAYDGFVLDREKIYLAVASDGPFGERTSYTGQI